MDSIFLDALRPDVRRALEARSIRRRFRAGERLWRAGEEPRALAVVLSGRVRVVRTVEGRRHVVHSEGPGAVLGEIPLVDGEPYPATAEAETAAECLMVPRVALEEAVRADPDVAWVLLRGLGRRVRHLVERLDSATHRSVESRLARWLADRADAHADARADTHAPADGRGFTLGRSQGALAEELGTVREVVARRLGTLVEDGVLERREGGRWAVADRAPLDALAHD